MGYYFALSPCHGCSRPFAYNPDLVPSVAVGGVREPICAVCVERVNPKRVENGLEPIRPLPGAYDEPADEGSVGDEYHGEPEDPDGGIMGDDYHGPSWSESDA